MYKTEAMHRLLITKTFEKVIEDERKATGIEPSLTSASKILSDYILDTQKMPFGEKSLYNYYKASINNENHDILIKQPKVVQALCSYLDYDSYEDFKEANGMIKSKKDTSKHTSIRKKKIIIAISFIFILLIALFMHSFTKDRWMVWKEDRYIEVSFNPEKYNSGQLKLYDENKIENFKKIEVDCSTRFFDNRGKVSVWYAKNHKKELEYFSNLGSHPETGKTLKPITDYMINKYVCAEE